MKHRNSTDTPLPLRTGRILFLGDSITDNGQYLTFIRAWMEQACLQAEFEIFNAGLSGETMSGLSEPDHPQPRPCLQSRFAKALALTSPDFVVLCYGMNDGIYYPFAPERLAAFCQGYAHIEAQLVAASIPFAVLTPTIFDAHSFAAKGNVLRPLGAQTYSYAAPYEDYNSVLQQYAEALRQSPPRAAECVVDLYTPCTQALAAAREKYADALWGDGIHPDIAGHWVMAQAILQDLFGATNAQLTALYEQLSAHDFQRFHALYAQDALAHNALKEATLG